MYSQINKVNKANNKGIRQVYFLLKSSKLTGSAFTILYTRHNVLQNLSQEDFDIGIVNLPHHHGDFKRSNGDIYTGKLLVQRYTTEIHYTLDSNELYELFDRVNVIKSFIYDEKVMKHFMTILCKNSDNINGLLWMYNNMFNIVIEDDYNNKYIRYMIKNKFMVSLYDISMIHYLKLENIINTNNE